VLTPGRGHHAVSTGQRDGTAVEGATVARDGFGLHSRLARDEEKTLGNKRGDGAPRGGSSTVGREGGGGGGVLVERRLRGSLAAARGKQRGEGAAPIGEGWYRITAHRVKAVAVMPSSKLARPLASGARDWGTKGRRWRARTWMERKRREKGSEVGGRRLF
jgi:hypothetical protein